MDKITEMLAKADILFDIRPLMESIGFAKDVDIFFAFTNKETKKCYKTGAIPPSKFERSSALNSDYLYDSVLIFLNKALVQFPELEGALEKAMELKEGKEKEIEIRVISQKGDIVKQEFVLAWPIWCCPCPFRPGCCPC